MLFAALGIFCQLVLASTGGSVRFLVHAEEVLGTETAAASLDAIFECGPEKSAKHVPAADLVGVIDNVQAAYRRNASLSARFIQESSMVALGGREVASGTVTFLKPGRMKWEYELPDPQTFLVRDESVWLFQPSLGQLVIDSLRSVLLADLPVAFLMGIGDLDRQFRAVRGCASGEFLVLVLAPRETSVGQEEVQLESFELLVSRSSFLPAGARVLDVGGNATLIRLLDVKSNVAGLNESDFVAQFPSGIDVTDRRDLPTSLTETNIVGSYGG